MAISRGTSRPALVSASPRDAIQNEGFSPGMVRGGAWSCASGAGIGEAASGRRDRQPVLDQPFDVKADGLAHVRFGLFGRLPGR